MEVELNEDFIKELNYKDVNTIDELRAHVKEDLKNRKTYIFYFSYSANKPSPYFRLAPFGAI